MKNTKIPITTMIEINTRKEAKKRGIPIQYILQKGWETINNQTTLNNELQEAKRKIESMAKLLAAQQRSINDIHNKEDKKQ